MSRRLVPAAAVLLLALLATASGRAGPDASAITIAARPTVLAAQPVGTVTLTGTVDSGRAGELVDIEAMDCGQQSFRGVVGATTTDGGRYEASYLPAIKTSLRAVSGGKISAAVTVEHKAMVSLRRIPRRAGQVFRVGVWGKWSFWRQRALLQQRRSGGWRTIRSVQLTEQWPGGFTTTFWGIAKLSVPTGSRLRALVPRAVAQPCYLAATSPVVRVTR